MSTTTAPDRAAGPLRTPPGPRTRHPMGSLPAYKRNPVLFFQDLQRAHGDVVRFKLGPWPATLLTHPEGIRHVIVANDANYCRGRFYEKFSLFFGQGLLTLDGEDWKRHRQVAQPAFLRTIIPRGGQHISGASEDLVRDWTAAADAGERVDVVDSAMILTLASLSRVLFGLDVSRDRSRAAVVEAIDFGVSAMFNQGTLSEMLPRWMPTSRNRAINRHKAVLTGMIERIRAEHERDTATTDLVDVFEGATDPQTGRHWSQQEIHDELITVFLAGQETTAMAMSWLVYLVASHPEVQDRLAAEVDTIPGDLAEAVTAGQLPYVRMVVEETLRLYPPIWLYTRDAIAEDEVSGFHIPAGSSVLVSPYTTHRRPDLWPDPDRFLPERFDPATAAPRSRFAYFPFGGGPRQCIGSHMAMFELQVALASIVRSLRIALADAEPVGVGEPVLSLRPVPSVAVTVARRPGRGVA